MDYIQDILTEINDIEVLKRISATLRVRNMMDYNAINEQIIMDLIIGISSNLSCQSIPELYFEDNKKWEVELVRICEPTFLEDIIANKKELSLNKLINMSRAEYKFF